jgi:predicted SprT family Zn-dependent metalloprotease
MDYTMAMFKEDYAECKNQLSALGYELQDDIPLVFNNRVTKSYGRCFVQRNRYTGDSWVTKIELSTKLFGCSSREEIKNTVMHDAIHAIPECHGQGHKGAWKRIANEVNRKYGYDISRTNGREDTEAYAEFIAQNRSNYTVKCEKCGHEWHYQRMSNCVKNPSRYTHTGCGGHLVRVK